MVETTGLKSRLVAVIDFACQCNITLYKTIKSFSSYPKQVRDLLEELAGLNVVLGPLTNIVRDKTEVDQSTLNLLFLRYGNACQEFEQEILHCLSRPGDNRARTRDWARLTYLGDNIDGFRRSLVAYKLTISIVLNHANLYVQDCACKETRITSFPSPVFLRLTNSVAHPPLMQKN